MPPPEVTMVTGQTGGCAFTARVASPDRRFAQVEVRARVSGILLKRLYAEGRPVKAGDALYQIDPEQARRRWIEARGALEVNRPS